MGSNIKPNKLTKAKIIRSCIIGTFIGLLIGFGLNNWEDITRTKIFIIGTDSHDVNEYSDFISDQLFYKYVPKYRESGFVKALAIYCNQSNATKGKLQCVYSEVNKIFNYSYHNDTIIDIDLLLKRGGVCRDYAVLYRAVLEEMGFRDMRFSHAKHHIFLVVNTGNLSYCIVDMNDMMCTNDWGKYVNGNYIYWR